MGCERDEAAKAKGIAERKFSDNDLLGAKQYAMKAHELNPELDGVSQLLTVLDVHIAAGIEVNGVRDFYAILQLDPWADRGIIKKQYKTLAVVLHPDKNRSFGADGAFKYVLEAWNVLSDRAKRSVYDRQRNNQPSVRSLKKAARHKASSHVSAGDCVNRLAGERAHMPNSEVARNADLPQKTSQHQLKSLTFWTECTSCKMQYEYLRIYLNYRLICRNCSRTFVAVELAMITANGSGSPFNLSFLSKSSHSSAKDREIQDTSNSAKKNIRKNCTMNDFDMTFSSLGTTLDETVHKKEKSGKKRKTEKGIGSVEESQVFAVENGSVQTGKVVGNKTVNSGKIESGEAGSESCGSRIMQHSSSSNGDPSKLKDGLCLPVKRCGTEPSIDIRKLLIDKARIEIRKRLEAMELEAAAQSTEVKSKETACLQFKVVEFAHFHKDQVPESDDSEVTSGDVLDLLKVPDPDFHDFDKNRSENCFLPNQVWALYDSDDGMPRIYAAIHKVVTISPFKVEICYLSARINDEIEPVARVDHGLAKACGSFKIRRKSEMIDKVNVFSHIVQYGGISKRKPVQIFPKKGDTWAIYKNWSSDWSSSTPAEVRHKYEMVEVLEDYTETEGACVTPLIKVTGFRTVYKRDMNPMVVLWIQRNEMLRFSHQVPSWKLTEEAKNLPNGCRDLDTAATPLELLHAMAGGKEEATDSLKPNA